MPARLDSHRSDGQFHAHKALEVFQTILLILSIGDFAGSASVWRAWEPFAGSACQREGRDGGRQNLWRALTHLVEIEDVCHSHGSLARFNFIDEVNAVARCELHRHVRRNATMTRRDHGTEHARKCSGKCGVLSHGAGSDRKLPVVKVNACAHTASWVAIRCPTGYHAAWDTVFRRRLLLKEPLAVPLEDAQCLALTCLGPTCT